jgi:hypothetical protein
MKPRFIVGAFAVAALAVTGVVAGDALKSGPQEGKKVPGPFHPTNLTGPQAGKKHCLVWQFGTRPVAMIFARDVNGPLTSLVKKIDKANAENTTMGSFVVFLSDDEGLGDKIKDVAKKEGIKKTVLTIDNPAGPQGYNVAKEAEVTVVLYNRHDVKANFAFKKGELKDKDVDAILKDVPKILPKK